MKAVMSKKIKEILNDPDKKADFLEGLNKMHRSKNEKSSIKIGDESYEMKFVNSWSEKTK